MSFVSSLLQAIVRLDGEAVVLHVGEKPYIVTPTEQVDLATKGLTIDAAVGILNQLLPPEPQNALEEFGAVQYLMPPAPELPGEHFTIVAARGGDDIWIEIRRRQVPDEDRVPLEMFAPPLEAVPETSSRSEQKPLLPPRERVALPPRIPEAPSAAPIAQAPVADVPPPTPKRGPSTPLRAGPSTPLRAGPTPVRPVAPVVPIAAAPPPSATEPAPVVPLTRSPIRPDAPPPLTAKPSANLEHVLRQAAARGASILYLSSSARPAIRVDGEIETLDGAPVLGPNEVESLLLTLMPERDAEALRSGAASEWICDIADLGPVRCMTFRDSRGPGGVFRLMRPRGISAEQLGLSRQIQGLALEREGLVLVGGARSSGKRTLISAFVDLINKSRHDHVVTIEREIRVTHERVAALISQREVRGGADEVLAEARLALREDPDVLVLENVRTPELMHLALDAAATGHLVIGGLAASSASGAKFHHFVKSPQLPLPTLFDFIFRQVRRAHNVSVNRQRIR
jgi:twitching motility protein PilT